jgi:hypothetical protein
MVMPERKYRILKAQKINFDLSNLKTVSKVTLGAPLKGDCFLSKLQLRDGNLGY